MLMRSRQGSTVEGGEVLGTNEEGREGPSIQKIGDVGETREQEED